MFMGGRLVGWWAGGPPSHPIPYGVRKQQQHGIDAPARRETYGLAARKLVCRAAQCCKLARQPASFTLSLLVGTLSGLVSLVRARPRECFGLESFLYLVQGTVLFCGCGRRQLV